MKRSPIRSISKKRSTQIPERKRLRIRQLLANPWCQACLPNCALQATDVHEIVNRSQRQTSWLESDLFISLCRSCHSWITEHPLWSSRHGFTLSVWELNDEALGQAERIRGVCTDKKCLINHMKESE